jgi:hypothetical protein
MKESRAFFLAAVLAAGAWNLILVVAALLNAHWVLTRVDGGQFQSLPIGLRICQSRIHGPDGLGDVLCLATVEIGRRPTQVRRASGKTSRDHVHVEHCDQRGLKKLQ